ncbi:MAG: large conductance mechanosensitive channel protein MscL [Rhizobiaceae bacterium]
MFGEFKKFIMKGNVMDLAIGVIIGGAFGAIVKSLVDDVLMPVVGAIFGGLDFSNYFAPLADGVTATSLDAAREQGAVLAYGSFITAVINFLIIGFIIFLIVRSLNKMMEAAKEEEEAAPAEPPAQEVLLSEIRDLLKK